jgi:hypothetical protein
MFFVEWRPVNPLRTESQLYPTPNNPEILNIKNG